MRGRPVCKDACARNFCYTLFMHDRIVSDPRIMGGQPVIRGTRITVALLLRELGRGATAAEIVDQYPHISPEDIQAAAAYAAEVVAGDVLMAAE